MQVDVSEIQSVSVAALERHGATPATAAEVGRATAMAEAHGNVICGLAYLESYCLQLESGRVDGRAVPVVTRPKPGAVLADARGGFAQPAFAAGLPEALAAARDCGVATLAVARSHTCTSLGYFCEQIAGAGLIGIGATNASPVVAPPGGRGRVLGTNPLAVSVPDGTGGMAMHFDSATSAVALGSITAAKAAGEPIPNGWAVDGEGDPTTDPEAALGGALLSAGGYKGWGFGLMVEVLAAAATGSVLSREVSGLKLADGPPHRLGQFYLLIEPGLHNAGFGAQVAELAEAVGAAGGRLPGAGRQPAETAEVPQALWARARELAGRS